MTQGSEFKVVIGVEWSAKGEEMEESAGIFTGGISDMMTNASKGKLGSNVVISKRTNNWYHIRKKCIYVN